MKFEEMQKKYSGKFVAILNEETVVASGETFSEVATKLQNMKIVNKSGIAIRFIRPRNPKWF